MTGTSGGDDRDDGPPPEGPDVRQHAEASGGARIYQAGRDQHFHYQDGVRRRRRAALGTVVDTCPYPGLAAFGPDQAQWFFGRDRLIAELTTRLDERARQGGALAVVGPSGAGKSSLLRAGLLPSLQEGAVSGSRRWPQALLTPTGTPVAALAAGIASALDLAPEAVAEMTAAGARQFAARLRQALRDRAVGPGAGEVRLVVVVDQLEELFTHCTDDLQRHRFVDLLSGLAESAPDGAGPVAAVVYGLRSDFYTPCANYPRLRDALQNSQVFVGPMSSDELRETILFPAEDVGMEAEPGLVELLLADLGAGGRSGEAGGYTAGRLPMLAHALRTTWLQRHGHVLTVQGYQATGGIRHALATTAEKVFAPLDDEARRQARRLLLRLVRIGDGTEDTRRRLSREELVDSSADPQSAEVVVRAFTEARLFTLQENGIEITHEALLHGWPRLRTWIDTDRAGHLTHQDLEEAATAWERGHHDESLLYRGSRLAVASAWADAADPGDLSPAGRGFLAAGVQAQRRIERVRTRVIAVLAVLLALALGAAGTAIGQWHTVTLQRQTVTGQRDRAASAQVAGTAQSLRSTDPELARRLAVASARLADTPESWSALVAMRNQWEDDALELPGFTATQADLDGTGRTLVAAAGTRVEFWDVRTRLMTGSYTAPANVHQVDLSDDGRTAAVSTDDGYIRLLDVSGARPRNAHAYPTVKEDGGLWPRMAVSPLGTYVMLESIDSKMESTLTVWDDPTGREIITLTGHGPVFFLKDSSFSPDEHVLSLPAGGTGKPFTWLDMRDKKELPVPVPYEGVKAEDIEGPVVFGPDGKSAALTLKNGTISLFDRSRGWSGTELRGAEAAPDHPVRFSPDGRFLVRNGDVWDRSSLEGTPVVHYSTTQSECYPLTALRFTADGSELRCVGIDGVVRSLDVSAFTGPPARTGADYREGAVSLDRSTFALTDGDRVDVWSPLSRTRRSTVAGTGSTGRSVERIQLSHDGRLLAFVADTEIEVWDTEKEEATLLGSLPVLDQEEPGAAAPPYLFSPDKAFAFSPDDKSLAVQVVKAETNVLTFWDLTTMRRINEVRADLGYPRNGGAVLFQPDGTSVIAAPNFGRVAFPSGRIITEGATTLAVDSVSDDGATLYTHPSGSRPDIQFRDARTLLPAGNDLRTGPVSAPLLRPESATAVSADGRLFATVHRTGPVYQIKVWDGRTRTQLGAPLTGYVDEIVALAFSPDGSALTSVDKHGRFFTHTIAPEQLIQALCARSGPLTEQEWKAHIPDVPYRRTC